MNILINVVEASAELAHADTKERFPNWEVIKDNISFYTEEAQDFFWEVIKDNISFYTEEAQDFFNDKYDYYFEVLTNCSDLDDED